MVVALAVGPGPRSQGVGVAAASHADADRGVQRKMGIIAWINHGNMEVYQ